ncbi:hypothetical protein GCM10023331_22760 [Algivirga pacifica]|uniref:Fungal lipase-type domain-containing protein n=2 Tax=Algivirga pacifica TaxID=1162670 RepID=A0ABP9DBU2_9BACT
MIYHAELSKEEKEFLQQAGYRSQWYPNPTGHTTDLPCGLTYGYLLPQRADKPMILAFRGATWGNHSSVIASFSRTPIGWNLYHQHFAPQAEQEVTRIAERMDIKILVTGHSMGGCMAQYFSTRNPAYIQHGITFQSPGIFFDKTYQKFPTTIDDTLPKVKMTHHTGKYDWADLTGGKHVPGDIVLHELQGWKMKVPPLVHQTNLLCTANVVPLGTLLPNPQFPQVIHEKKYERQVYFGLFWSVKKFLGEFIRLGVGWVLVPIYKRKYATRKIR